MRRLLVLAGAVLATALLVLPATAQAFVIALDLNGAFLTSGSKTDGFGGALRLGQALDVPGAIAILEVGGATTGFSNDTVNQVFGGGRLGVGEFLRPSLYGHLGYGWLNHTTPVATALTPSSALVRDGSGLYLEGGVALDLVLAPVSVGAHVAYDRFVQGDFGAEAPGFLLVGVLGSLTF